MSERTVWVRCSTCNGSGVKNAKTCTACDGKGGEHVKQQTDDD
jgi:DnaJ-class molecular chaperone